MELERVIVAISGRGREEQPGHPIAPADGASTRRQPAQQHPVPGGRGAEALVTAEVSVVLVNTGGKPQRIPKDVGEWLTLKRT